MKFRNQILASLAALVWLFPALANASMPAPSDSQPLPPAAVARSGPAITVVSSDAPSKIAVVNSAGSAACGLTQDQAALLNQPADCFNLAPGRLAAQPSIGITQLTDTPAVEVADVPVVRFLPYNLLPTVPDSSVPSLPLPIIAFVIVTSAILMPARTRKKILVPRLSAAYWSFTQLQMMRC